jgi:hypothetical protein
MVMLSEMLYARTRGALNLLNFDSMREIAAFPAKMQLSGSAFASFLDCHETSHFNPGIIARLAQRTGKSSLINLLAHPAELESD